MLQTKIPEPSTAGYKKTPARINSPGAFLQQAITSLCSVFAVVAAAKNRTRKFLSGNASHKNTCSSKTWQAFLHESKPNGFFPCLILCSYRSLAIHRAAAVDYLAADIRRKIGSEEQSDLGNIFGRAAATQRNLLIPELDGPEDGEWILE